VYPQPASCGISSLLSLLAGGATTARVGLRNANSGGADIIAKCHQCGKPADTHTNCKNDGCHLLFIQCDDCAKQYDGCCTAECHTVYNLPLEAQIELRKGIDKGMMVFNKSKKRLRPRLDEMNKR
jgi:predicted sulfurtransferase